LACRSDLYRSLPVRPLSLLQVTALSYREG